MRLREWIVPLVAAWLGIFALLFDRSYLWTVAMVIFAPWLVLRLWRLRASLRQGR